MKHLTEPLKKENKSKLFNGINNRPSRKSIKDRKASNTRPIREPIAKIPFAMQNRSTFPVLQFRKNPSPSPSDLNIFIGEEILPIQNRFADRQCTVLPVSPLHLPRLSFTDKSIPRRDSVCYQEQEAFRRLEEEPRIPGSHPFQRTMIRQCLCAIRNGMVGPSLITGKEHRYG